jgi:thiol-disulfide isomerase/thioredoxin
MKKKSLKRNIIEWAILICVPLLLYITGLHTEVIGKIQSLLLHTGLKNAEIELTAENMPDAEYDLSLISLSGKKIAMEEFKGKLIFLNFWASWCPPCIAEMPSIENLYEEINNESVKFILISLDENAEDAIKFVDKKNIKTPVYFLNGPVPQMYRSSTIPTTFVISPKGKLVFKQIGMANYNGEKFKKALLNLLKKDSAAI